MQSDIKMVYRMLLNGHSKEPVRGSARAFMAALSILSKYLVSIKPCAARDWLTSGGKYKLPTPNDMTYLYYSKEPNAR